MKTKTYSIGALILLFVLVGCSNIYTPEKLGNCEQGMYDIPTDIKEKGELSGINMKGVAIINNEDTCVAIIHLAQPINILGTEVSTMPLYTCNKNYMQVNKEKG